MIRAWALALIVGYVPGALFFRLPIARRELRAEQPAEERIFWHVMLSVVWSVTVAFALAWAHRYSFERLVIATLIVSAAIAAFYRGRLRYISAPTRVSWTVALPLIAIVIGLVRFFPASEYVIGGKDPGTYMNEGIQIAQRGAIVVHEAVVADVPSDARDLFFSPHLDDYYLRFMGFFIQNTDSGAVIGQFPHLFPASIAIGYGLYGLSGARMTVGVWSILGLVAVYMFGRRLVGRAAATGATVLLGLHVAEVWFAKYPNSEVMLQAFVFAALLAFAHAFQDDDAFFAPVAALLIGLQLFIRVDALLFIAAMAAAATLIWVVDGRRPSWTLLATLALISVCATVYLLGPLAPYSYRTMIYLQYLPAGAVTAGSVGAVVSLALLWWARRRFSEQVRAVVPVVVIAVVVGSLVYAYWFRHPVFRLLLERDAYALRNFTQLYLLPLGLAMSAIGLVLVVRRSFWEQTAFIATFVTFAMFLFYKLGIQPFQFWTARRFLPVILPGALLLAAGAAVGPGLTERGLGHLARRTIGLVLLVVLGWQYAAAAAPIVPHVEYAGIIPALEEIAARVGDRDLLIVESRNVGSDLHVLATPLADIYARQVLLLNSPRPDKLRFEAFLAQALQRYDRVLFLGGGGTDLLSRRIQATPLTDGKIHVPEYENADWNVFPSGVRWKDFDYSIYQLTLGSKPAGAFSLDVGFQDDLNVVRFHAKEATTEDGVSHTFRWSQDASFVSIPALSGAERVMVVTMHDGGRPANAPPARVSFFLNDQPIGTVDVTSGFREYSLPLPAEAVALAARATDPVQLKIETPVWRPAVFGIGNDLRELGVMVDRIDIR